VPLRVSQRCVLNLTVGGGQSLDRYPESNKNIPHSPTIKISSTGENKQRTLLHHRNSRS
jgi:hypothetical protein